MAEHFFPSTTHTSQSTPPADAPLTTHAHTRHSISQECLELFLLFDTLREAKKMYQNTYLQHSRTMFRAETYFLLFSVLSHTTRRSFLNGFWLKLQGQHLEVARSIFHIERYDSSEMQLKT